MTDVVMYDLLDQPLRIGDEVIYANSGRLWKGKLLYVSGLTCGSCQITVPELGGRVVTLQLRKSRTPSYIRISQRKLIETGEFKIKSSRLIKIEKGSVKE